MDKRAEFIHSEFPRRLVHTEQRPCEVDGKHCTLTINEYQNDKGEHWRSVTVKEGELELPKWSDGWVDDTAK